MSVESGESEDARRIRVLLAKVGLDGHDRGVHVLARKFRDAGFEVIYTGLHRRPEEVVQAAVHEDVNVVGISIHSGADGTLVPEVIEGLEEYGAREDTLLVVGGILSEGEQLKTLGVDEVFGPGASLEDIVEYIREHAPARD